MFSKKSHHMSNEVKSEKKSHKGLIGALKSHFKSDEDDMEKEEKEEKMVKKYNAPRKDATKNMDKDSRKTLAISIMKKKMKD